MLSAWVFRIASTCQTRFSSYPQLCCRNAFTTSFAGAGAVKFAGSGLGNVGGAAGAGDEGAWADAAGACAAGACAGAGGTCSWATTFTSGKTKTASETTPANWRNERVKTNSPSQSRFRIVVYASRDSNRGCRDFHTGSKSETIGIRNTLSRFFHYHPARLGNANRSLSLVKLPPHSNLYLDRDRKTASHSERFRRDLQHRRGLLALVLGPLDQP